MSKSGKVVSWKGPFGFVEGDDGESVYIHTSEIEGGRLRIGLTVNYDVEEGKDGKPKGTNVAGPAVLAKGEKLSDEDFEADRKRIAEIKEANMVQVKKEFEPVWELVQGMSRSNRRHLAKVLAKNLGIEISKEEEKRVDSTQKKGNNKYTKGEFLAFYGKKEGESRWNSAKKSTKRKRAKGDKKAKDEDAKEEKTEKKTEE